MQPLPTPHKKNLRRRMHISYKDKHCQLCVTQKPVSLLKNVIWNKR